MKTIYVVRHAKSSWKDKFLNDFERPLNDRGKNDAPFMGNILSNKNVNLDLILSSPSKRTKLTSQKIAQQIKYDKQIKFLDYLYLADANTLIEIIKSNNESIKDLMIVGHNPGITNLVNTISQDQIENIPTCGIVKLLFKKEWKELNRKTCELSDFIYPKMFK